jgi:rod shape-determining protein MreC
VHDKTVRRRRAVLALLVVISLILITASFGSGGGALHTVQSGFLDVVSPVESVASKALTPVHDLISAIDDVVHASGQRNQLRRELAAANKKIASLEAGKQSKSDSSKLHHLDTTLQLQPDGPVNASVIGQPASIFVSAVTIDAGLGAGVHVNDPVIDPDGVVGIVTTAAADSAVVTLINDPSSGVTARDAPTREIGVIAQKPGSPGELQMQYVSRPSRVKVGDLIVTAGEQDTDGASFFPANVPIGIVKQSTSTAGGVITVSPAADLSSLGSVQVLTAVPRP